VTAAKIVRCILMLMAITFSHVAYSSSFDECKGHAKVAREVMEMRQRGESMISMMDMAARMGEFRDGMETLIRLAFDRPAMRSVEGKMREVVEFEGEILSRCLDEKDPR